MLADFYESDFYIALAYHLDSDGKWGEIPEILSDIKEMVESKEVVESKERWYDLNKIGEWLITEPEITDKDLRPKYSACKEKLRFPIICSKKST